MRNVGNPRTVVVVGGSTGLGWEIGRAFAARGDHVCLVARDSQRLQQGVTQLQAIGGQATGEIFDATDDRQVAEGFARIRTRYRSLDVVINAVGRSHRAAIEATTPADLQLGWETNVLSTVRVCREVLPDLLRVRGHLVNIGSLASFVAAPHLGAYPATKFALAAYTHQLRLELEPRGLHVLLVCPGPLRRDDAGHRYDAMATELPEAARRPGGGARLRLIEPAWLAEQIIRACERRSPLLVVPRKVRWLAALYPLWPRAADWLIRAQTR